MTSSTTSAWLTITNPDTSPETRATSASSGTYCGDARISSTRSASAAERVVRERRPHHLADGAGILRPLRLDVRFHETGMVAARLQVVEASLRSGHRIATAAASTTTNTPAAQAKT